MWLFWFSLFSLYNWKWIELKWMCFALPVFFKTNHTETPLWVWGLERSQLPLTFGVLAEVSSFLPLWYKITRQSSDVLKSFLSQPVGYIQAITNRSRPTLNLQTNTRRNITSQQVQNTVNSFATCHVTVPVHCLIFIFWWVSMASWCCYSSVKPFLGCLFCFALWEMSLLDFQVILSPQN